MHSVTQFRNVMMNFINFTQKLGLCSLVLGFLSGLANAASQSSILIDDSESLTEKCRALRSRSLLPNPCFLPENSKDYWVLSLDGGGVRGILHLATLAKLEEQTGKRVVDMFDGISGTSVGGIIATLLTMPNPDDPSQPKYHPRQLLELFIANRSKMFQSKWQSFGGFFGTKYKTTGLKNFLHSLLGENSFKNRWLPTVLVTHDLHTYQERLFSTIDDEDYYAKHVAMATAAAPTYFKPQHVFPIGDPSSRGYFVSDGGTCMNNPSLVGIGLLHKYYNVQLERVHILSLGTGVSNIPLENVALRRGGALSWVRVIADLCMGGQESIDNDLVSSYCGDRYHRFNPILAPCDLAMDDISDAHRDALLRANATMLTNKAAEFDNVARHLAEAADAKPMKFVEDLSAGITPQRSYVQRLYDWASSWYNYSLDFSC